MRKNLVSIMLYFCKLVGLFYLSKWFNRTKLRILCYHSFNNDDEVQWPPGLFIKISTFNKRLDFLINDNYSVIPLGDAVQMMKENTLTYNATVITIDDGWAAVKEGAHDLLKEKNLPYTIYLTSYYSQKQTPIFNLVVPYVFYKTHETVLYCENNEVPVKGLIDLEDKALLEETISDIIEYGHSKINDSERVNLMKYLCEELNVSYKEIEKSRVFCLLNAEEIRGLAQSGVDIQLHTHRHQFPSDEKDALKELQENRGFLEPLVYKSLTHFCYPDGIWSPDQLPFLEQAGIESATTCDHGLNTNQTNMQTLKRLLDAENKLQIQFEAEMCGFIDLLRIFNRAVKLMLKPLGWSQMGNKE